MKKTRYINKLAILLLALTTLIACDPFEEDKPDAGFVAAPSSEQLDFTITQGDDEFHVVLKNTSSVNGLVTWDLGNGNTAKGDDATAYYPTPDTYTIKLTVSTNGGSNSITKTFTQTETDYAIFSDPKFILLSGGVDDLDGKTWVVDSLSQGHLGVGPAGSDGLAWWSAPPLAKSGLGLYDDKLTFKIVGFETTYANNGNSYIKGYRGDDSNYSNGVDDGGGDLTVEYTPQPGTWFLEEVDGKTYLTLSGPTPIFPGFDTGAENGKYEVLSIEENLLDLVSTGGDGNAWHHRLIPEGYVKPSVEVELLVVAGTGDNTFDVSLTNINIPDGQSIDGMTIDFGDGDPVQVNDYMTVTSHTYMRKGTYTITVTVNTSVGDINLSHVETLEKNHPDYIEFLLDQMVVYADFSEVSLAPVNGEDCAVNTVANPDRIYPNRSANVAFYSKTNQQWANANLKLPSGFRFDLRNNSTFKLMVYGKAGDQILLKLENTDRGGNAWQTGTADLIYTIQQDNTWEVAEYNFTGVSAGWDWTGDIFTSDVTTDDNFSHDFYNIVRIMLNPGVGEGTHEFYFDELSGPHVEGIKSATIGN